MAGPDFEIEEEEPVFHTEPNDSDTSVNDLDTSVNKPIINGMRSETVVILPAPLSSTILQRLERQTNKYWHFKFVKESDFINLEIKLLKELEITVQPNYGGKKHADLTLFHNDKPIGKIHFLHCDRKDICDPTTFYVKLHFYEFEDQFFEPVKQAMKAYFQSLDKSRDSMVRGGKRKTRKHKRNARRKTRR